MIPTGEESAMKPLRMHWLVTLWLVTLTFVAGCSSPGAKRAQLARAGDSPAVAAALAPGDAAAVPPGSAKEYVIQPGDQLDIKLFYNPELNEQLTVRSDGRITLQLVNDVVAAGRTPSELTAILNQAYSAELENPKLAVIVRTSVGDKVYVDGEVNRAGVFPLIAPTTVLQAISQAGGIREAASTSQVIVLRKTDDGKVAAIELDLERALKGNQKQDILLKPNDIVYVPKSRISNINTWIDQYIRKNIPLPIGLGYSL